LRVGLVALSALWVVCFVLFGGESGGFFYSIEPSPAAAEDLFKKLKVERLKWKRAAPDVPMEDIHGKPVRMADFKGKIVFLNFWATWCPPCIREMTTMETLHQELGEKGLVVLAVNFRESGDQVRGFIRSNKFTFTTVLDPKGKVSKLYRVWSLPMTIFVGKRGEIMAQAYGYRDWHTPEAKAFFLQLLGER